ncbi:ABC transporter ATP-binding protein [Exiguobacterium sp. S22-S28]|uniref:ABC transporter ATP-binding protein n=1 Tax=Exiguobacterium sp. S22-S28 TaxID=3342768 RepID=UPI00372D0BBE
MIYFQDVGKRYKKTWALQPMSETIQAGTILALSGPNGAGKSTILNLLTRSIRPTVGSIQIDTTSVAFMPDDFEFEAIWTVGETYDYLTAMQGQVSEKSILERVGLLEHQDKKISMLSKGMRQRLLLAQALVTRPAILLLDEPTNGLDPSWMNELSLIIKEEAARGCSIIFSTHQLDIASQLADEIWWIDRGIIQEKIQVKNATATFNHLRRHFLKQV